MHEDMMVEEIDIEQLLRTLLHRKWIILLCTLLCAGTMFGYKKASYKPKYTSTAKMIINVSWEPGETVTTDPLKTAISLADSYQVLMKSNEVLGKVAEVDGLNETAGSLNGKISVTAQTSTPIMQITVTDSSAQHAHDICEAVTKVSAEALPEIIGDGVTLDVVTQATLSSTPIANRTAKSVIVAGGVGFVASLAYYVLKFLFNNTINTEADVQRFLNTPVIGVIPDYKHNREKLVKGTSAIHAGEQSSFSFNEAYKTLGTNISFTAAQNHVKTILITSSAPREGKSTVAMNMADTLAARGKKVLLVEADLRASVKENLGGNAGHTGLSDLLESGKIEDLDQALQTPAEEKYSLLSAGTSSAEAIALLSSEACTELFAKLKETYDFIIVDTPSVSVVTDAAILSRCADGVVLVAEAGGSTIESARLAKKNLEAVEAKILGTVLIGYDSRRFGKHDGYYYSRKNGKHYYA